MRRTGYGGALGINQGIGIEDRVTIEFNHAVHYSGANIVWQWGLRAQTGQSHQNEKRRIESAATNRLGTSVTPTTSPA
jgi:hypothetical protein